MKTGRVDTVGVVVADLTNPFYPEILRALTDTLDAAGQKVTHWNSDGPGNDAALEAIRAGSVDGVAFTTVTESSEPLRAALLRSSPVVLVNRVVEDLACDQVSAENLTGGALVADYFLAHGHNQVAILGGPLSASTSRDRGIGLERALSSAEIPLSPNWSRRGPFTHYFGYSALTEMLATTPAPTARSPAANAARRPGYHAEGAVAKLRTQNCQQLWVSSANRSPLAKPRSAGVRAHRFTAASNSAKVIRRCPPITASLSG
jgi:LacI family transcriptional regulator